MSMQSTATTSEFEPLMTDEEVLITVLRTRSVTELMVRPPETYTYKHQVKCRVWVDWNEPLRYVVGTIETEKGRHTNVVKAWRRHEALRGIVELIDVVWPAIVQEEESAE